MNFAFVNILKEALSPYGLAIFFFFLWSLTIVFLNIRIKQIKDLRLALIKSMKGDEFIYHAKKS